MTQIHSTIRNKGAPPVSLLGIPLEAGAGRGGAAMGPAALRTAGIAAELQALGHAVSDLGDVAAGDITCAPVPAESGRMRNLAAIAAWTRAIAEAARAAFAADTFPIFLGGDHALSMGTVSAAAQHARAAGRKLFVLWLDAHADYNTPATSPSGNMHGMPVAALCGEPGLEAVFDGLEHEPVAPSRFHLFGIRSIDPGERQLLKRRGVNVCDMRMIDESGVCRLLQDVIDGVRARDGHLHVSLDVDFLDPALAPGVGTVVPGGATYREAHLIMELLHDSGLVTSLDLVELNPFLDDRGKSALLLVDLVASLFGRKIIDRPASVPGMENADSVSFREAV